MEKTFLIPKSISYGFGLGEDKKWFLGASFKKQDGGGYENQIMNLDNVQFKDSKLYSFGGFYLPQYDSFTSYFNTIIYRFGVRYESGGLYVNGEQINDFGINFGFSLPLANLSSANIGFEIGQRGTNKSGLVKENYFGLKLKKKKRNNVKRSNIYTISRIFSWIPWSRNLWQSFIRKKMELGYCKY